MQSAHNTFIYLFFHGIHGIYDSDDRSDRVIILYFICIRL